MFVDDGNTRQQVVFSWTLIQSFRIQLQKQIYNIWRIKWDGISASSLFKWRFRRRSRRRRCCLSSLFTSPWFPALSPTHLPPRRAEEVFSLNQNMAQNLSDMRRFTFEIGTAQLRSITEIAQPHFRGAQNLNIASKQAMLFADASVNLILMCHNQLCLINPIIQYLQWLFLDWFACNRAFWGSASLIWHCQKRECSWFLFYESYSPCYCILFLTSVNKVGWWNLYL